MSRIETHTTQRANLANLKPHPRNYREHPEAQIEQIAISLQEHGQYRPIVIARDGTILAGHGVALAAERAGLDVVNVTRLDIDPHGQEAIKIVVADNELSRLASVDDRALVDLLRDVDNLEGTGFDDESLASLMYDSDASDDTDGAGSDAAGDYETSTPSPIYQPTGENVELHELTDTRRRDALMHDIVASDLDPALRTFLTVAAQRHVVFDYRKIAEYYANADAETQRLMEDSALVIPDFDRAIELGYVRLTERLAELIAEQTSDV